MQPTIIEVFDPDYTKLCAVAKVLEAFSQNNAQYLVDNVYFDYGQDWFWTTICRRGRRGGKHVSDCQILSPRQWENILMSESPEELFKCIEDIRNDKYFNDK
jgi:hypothetical protein